MARGIANIRAKVMAPKMKEDLMKGACNIATKGIICFVFLLLFMLESSRCFCAQVRTIDFDQYPNGDPIGHNRPITNAYADWGVALSCHGVYPDDPLVNDNNAYAYQDRHAVSGRNVMGGRLIGYGCHWLNYQLCYGVVEFDKPVDLFRIYGAGDKFQVFYYNQDGDRKGPIGSKGESFLEISHENDSLKPGHVITKVEFGSYTGGYHTYFDDLTFRTAEIAVK